MTARFAEGQEVEVWCYPDGGWEKAKIAEIWTIDHSIREYTIQFPDGTRAVFNANHIQAVRIGAFPAGITSPINGGAHRAFNKDDATP